MSYDILMPYQLILLCDLWWMVGLSIVGWTTHSLLKSYNFTQVLHVHSKTGSL